MLKRSFDFLASLFAILLLLPLFLVVSLWIKLNSPGPVFYRGRRVGRFGRPFRISKFRTMVVNADQIGGPSTADDDRRITSAGKWLRKRKLDELPQLFDVLLGRMSLVGPRPEVQKYIDLFSDEEQAILQVRPGITDWASIWNSDEGAVLAGSQDPDRAFEELIRPTKVRLQLKYVRERSFCVDLKILAFTVFKLFKKGWLPAELFPFGRLQPAAATSQTKVAARQNGHSLSYQHNSAGDSL
ncbi:MAG: sugar transferase [Thermoguttaceae bacterium]